MQASYAVIWSQRNGEIGAGKLALGDDALVLDGTDALTVQYAEIEWLRSSRDVDERLRGRATLVLDLIGGERLRISSLDAPGSLHELAENLYGRIAPQRVA